MHTNKEGFFYAFGKYICNARTAEGPEILVEFNSFFSFGWILEHKTSKPNPSSMNNGSSFDKPGIPGGIQIVAISFKCQTFQWWRHLASFESLMSPLVILQPRKVYLEHFGSKIAKIVWCYWHNLGQSEKNIFDFSLCDLSALTQTFWTSMKKASLGVCSGWM